MIGKSHIIFGTGCSLIASHYMGASFTDSLMYLPAAIIGSLFPDLDSFNSRLKRNILVWLLTLPLTFFGHRTWSHSILFWVLVTLPIFFIPVQFTLFWLAFSVGYASHIIGDFLTPMGVPLLYPFKRKFRAPVTFRTGSFFEIFVAFTPIIAFFAVFNPFK